MRLISDKPHIETETMICKNSMTMLWDHGHPYVQSIYLRTL